MTTTSMTQQRAVIVLGMHRSGTSVLTKGISALGAAIGDKGCLLESDEWNAMGYFEHADIVNLNDSLLRRVGKRWDSLMLPDWTQLWPACQPFEAQAQSLLKKHFADAALFGIKDPRACRLLPFWQSVFQRSWIAESYVIALRNPTSVARSLAARNGFRAEKAYQLWLSHMVAAIRDTMGKPCIVVDYDLLIESPLAQLERVAKALKLPGSEAIRQNCQSYAREFVSRELRHGLDDMLSLRDDPRAGELVVRAYELLHRMARDDFASPADAKLLQHEWHTIERRLDDDRALVDYIDECEDRINALALDTSGPEQSASVRPTLGSSIMREDENSVTSTRTETPPQARVSVVIPLYNHAKFIRETISSALEQTLPPLEVIVVDDGSSDESAAIVTELSSHHPEIVFWTWPNQGAYRALNAGMQRATGEFIAILNSDDVYAPNRLAECIAMLRDDPEADAVTTAVTFIDNFGAPCDNPWYARARAAFAEQGELALGLLHANFLVSTSNLVMRRDLIDAIGMFAPLRYAHDLEFFLRLVLAGRKLSFLDRPLLAYRMHVENTISESPARADIESAMIFVFFLYRKRLLQVDTSEWQAWLERYIEIIDRKQLLDLVEYFLALMEGQQPKINLGLNEELHRLLALVGGEWTRPNVEASPLAELVAARNNLLRRNNRIEQAERVHQSLQIAEMIEGKAWLESQWKASQAEVTELFEGNKWLESQWKASQAEADELLEGNKRLESQWKATQAEADELFEGKKWLEARWKEGQQEVVVRDRQLAQLRVEADSIYRRLDEVLASRSWRMTRPVRVAADVAKRVRGDMPLPRIIYHVAAKISRVVPFPSWVKARVYATLVDKAYPNVYPAKNAELAPQHESLVLSEASNATLTSMRPEHCGLVEGLVSIVLPVYNQAYLLAESIDSVLNQTYQHFELIIIDDGSTDGVETVLERYLDHSKVRCFTQANQRLPKALSNGFSFARGEFWTWTSADNIMEPRMLEILVGKLRAELELGMTFADYYAIDDRGNLLQDPTWRAHNRPNPASGEIRLPHTIEELNIVQDNFIGPCFMYRGWIGLCLGDYDPQLGVEDYDYWMRINAFFPIRHLGDDSLLYRYRVHDNTLSAKAHEHKIFEKAKRLMAYEKERAAFYTAPPLYVADTSGRSWLQAQGVHDPDINAFEDDVGATVLAVINSECAEKNISKLLHSGGPVAVIINRSDTRYHKLARLFTSGNCIVLAGDNKTAERVRLLSLSCPVVDANSGMALKAMQAFAKNLLFVRTTRSVEELARQMPRPIIVQREHHVVLQVDSFTQGGMENVVIDLALYLKNSCYRVTVANFGKSGDAAAKAKESGLDVVSLSADITDEAYRSWMVEHKVDLVNAHYSIRGAAVCFDAGIPFMQTIHNSYVWLDPPQIEKYRASDRYTTQYICVSMTAARYADVVLGLDVSKMRVVPNGIDPCAIDAENFEANRTSLRRAWGVEAETPVYLNVASIMATKAQLPLVKAFAHVVEKIPGARLVLLGAVMEAPYQAAIEKAVNELGLQKNIVFAGYDRYVSRYYHASDVFVLPSYWEGWSLSLGEAMANGMACIITDVGSAYEFEGFNNVEIVEPPFSDVALLNYRNLVDFVYSEDIAFEKRLTDAMVKVANLRRTAINISLAERLSRDRAYRTYLEISHTLIRSNMSNVHNTEEPSYSSPTPMGKILHQMNDLDGEIEHLRRSAFDNIFPGESFDFVFGTWKTQSLAFALDTMKILGPAIYTIEHGTKLKYLDVGAGAGFGTEFIASLFSDPHGALLFECHALELSNQWTRFYPFFNKKITISTTNLYDVEDKSFDIVSSSHVIEHLEEEDAVNFISKMRAVATRFAIVTCPWKETVPRHPEHKFSVDEAFIHKVRPKYYEVMQSFGWNSLNKEAQVVGMLFEAA